MLHVSALNIGAIEVMIIQLAIAFPKLFRH